MVFLKEIAGRDVENAETFSNIESHRVADLSVRGLQIHDVSLCWIGPQTRWGILSGPTSARNGRRCIVSRVQVSVAAASHFMAEVIGCANKEIGQECSFERNHGDAEVWI